MIIRGHNGTLGLLADEVNSVVSADEVRPLAPGHTATEYAEGEFTVDGENVVLLDCERLLLAEERQRIVELQSQLAQRRNALDSAQ
jgi:chemotaxis signal transduction protein